jgi:hypothetical protein
VVSENYACKIGIIAYGSLIAEPGEELAPLIINRIACKTPFNVEYGRYSKTRGGGPTLIPVNKGGAPVNGYLLLLQAGVSLADAKSMLWRRETRVKGRPYKAPENPDVNNVIVASVYDFMDCENVLYTSISSNIFGKVTATKLAKCGIDSILTNAGSFKMDGLRYLQQAIADGIQTPLTKEYLAEVLRLSKTESLDAAIVKFDLQRSYERFKGFYDKHNAIAHQVIAAEIKAKTGIKEKLEVYGKNYSFIQSRGRIYTKDVAEKEIEKIICNCQNCQKDLDFPVRYPIYEPFIKAEAIDLCLLVNSKLPYSEKLELCHFITGGASSIEFNFSEERILFSLVPGDEGEIATENMFTYEMILSSFFKKQSSMAHLFQNDYLTKKDKFLKQYSTSIYPEELVKKTISSLRENTEKMRDTNAEQIFIRLVDGELIDLRTKTLLYQDMFYYVIANENFLFLKFLEARDFISNPRAIKTIEKSVGPIHFEDRSSTEFERLVFSYLLNTNVWESLEWLGETGDDGGRDIWGLRAGESYCFQCANYKLMKLKKATDDIDKLVADHRIPDHWILYCGGRVSNPVRQNIKVYGKDMGIKGVTIHTGSEFEELLRCHTPVLIKRFVEGETFPEPDLPDFHTLNTSAVVLVKNLLKDWLYHELLPSIDSLYKIYNQVMPTHLTSKEMVFLIFAFNDIDYDFEMQTNDEPKEFSFEEFFKHLANSPTHQIPVLNEQEQERLNVFYDGYSNTITSRSIKLPVNWYEFYDRRKLEDGRILEIYFTKSLQREIDLRIGVS